MKTDHRNSDTTITAGSHISYWLDSGDIVRRSAPLRENLETDVVIVGGGIAGISVAYNLSRAGMKVVLVEDGLIASGESGRTTAHLVTALDDRYYDIIKTHGEKNAQLIAESHLRAIDFVESVVQQENIDCDFKRVDGYLFLHPSDKPDALDRELEATQKVGLSTFLSNEIPGASTEGRSLVFESQAQFHPVKYLAGLVNAIHSGKGQIFTETHAVKIDHNGITTREGFSVKANHVVVATNTPVNDLFAMHLKQFPYRTYVIGALIEKGILPDALWWDTGDRDANKNTPPYHYVRLQSYDEEYDLLICGGEDHPVGDTSKDNVPEEERYALLEEWARAHFPIGEIRYQWSGQVMEPADSLAYIGHNPWDENNVYIATGDSGNGMTYGVIAGILLKDMIMGNENVWEEIYKPSRLSLSKAGVILKEIAGTLGTSVKHSGAEGDEHGLSEIRNGEGKILKIDGKKCAVSRDMHGKLRKVAAECPHLKAIVKWNKDEQSWDCPWHGSRFSCDGKVINGPANDNLEKQD